ncbi:MAG: DUF1838 family protein [Trebonia sp.]
MTAAIAGRTPREQVELLARIRASTDGTETTSWWSGDIYGQAPGEPYRHLFGFEGLNVSRLVPVDGGYEMLGREAAFYLDPVTREILDRWTNPVTGEQVDVVHIWNDPVNQRMVADGPRGPFRLSATLLGDQVCVNMDIPLAYPSPLPTAEFPDNSADDTYRALELFQFYAPATALDDDSDKNVPHTLSWARLSPWTPWMAMGQRPGGLVFHCRGVKMDYSGVPERTRAYIAERNPQYASAPEAWSAPNETSWTYFRKITADRQEAGR